MWIGCVIPARFHSTLLHVRSTIKRYCHTRHVQSCTLQLDDWIKTLFTFNVMLIVIVIDVVVVIAINWQKKSLTYRGSRVNQCCWGHDGISHQTGHKICKHLPFEKPKKQPFSNEEKKLVLNIRVQLLKQPAQFPSLSSSACTGLCKANETVVFTLIDPRELSDIE